MTEQSREQTKMAPESLGVGRMQGKELIKL